MKTLKLGTRKSLLAWAQSSWVAREIERLNPDTRVELVGIETRGDRILNVSLQSVEGKEFFVAELDDALKSGRVDFTVHSMKDLSLDRPAEFTLAAIPPRENPRDAVLFGPGVREKIGAGKTLLIGTSSPRRLENIPVFLGPALPTVDGRQAKLEFREIRGNVNTRLSRVHEPQDSERHLDGVVLAFAGLIRLYADAAGRAELKKLLNGVRWMILPLKECPTAAAQGALAVECRKNDVETLTRVARLNDAESVRRVSAERAILADWGGGCHQKFGATCISVPGLDELLHIRGLKPDGTFVEELRWKAPPAPAATVRAWDGNAWRSRSAPEDAAAETEGAALTSALKSGAACFVAHSRACTAAVEADLRSARLWTSGVSSWFRLAQKGLWIEGCAEGLGFDALRTTFCQPVLSLPELEHWTALTHEGALDGWDRLKAVATYRVPAEGLPEPARKELSSATHVFWSSGSQYDLYGKLAPASAVHSCGPGKTADHLQSKGIRPTVFPTVQEWKKWLKI